MKGPGFQSGNASRERHRQSLTAIQAASSAPRCARDEQARKQVSPWPLGEGGMLLCDRGSEDVFGTYRDPWGVSLPLMQAGKWNSRSLKGCPRPPWLRMKTPG